MMFRPVWSIVFSGGTGPELINAPAAIINARGRAMPLMTASVEEFEAAS